MQKHLPFNGQVEAIRKSRAGEEYQVEAVFQATMTDGCLLTKQDPQFADIPFSYDEKLEIPHIHYRKVNRLQAKWQVSR